MESPKDLASAFDSETFGKDGSFHLDKPVGSASISPCGRDVVLASRQGLHIIDLDSPYAPPRHLAHHTPWEVADVQWSPFAARDHWIVSTSNQKALVWNLGMVNRKSCVEHVLHGHKRAITDINFSAHHPDILATCAVDSYVHCWDIRRPARPAITFCDWFAGATQVKWNRQESHILASSHDKFLKIWDDRKGAHPLRSIAAHSTKIYGVDWDRFDNRSIVTCSLDRSFKIWNVDNEDDVPQLVFHTSFPVWRARHTPFGYGLLALPQRGNHDLHLYDRRVDVGDQVAKSVHRFSGHRDQVKEFLWRPRGTVTSTIDDREFQLVSWGTDNILRLHEVSKEVLSRVSYQKGMEVKRTINFTRRGATYKTFRDEPIKPGEEDSDDAGAGTSALPTHSALTVGMSRRSMPFVGGYGSGGFMSSAVSQKFTSPKVMDPVSWMRGVKIGKRAASPSAVEESVESLLSPGLRAIPAWDAFESLGEEVTACLNKFPKVKIEDIDVQRRRLTLSLSGLWTTDKLSPQLKCRFDFPLAYPKTAAPLFTLEKTTALSDEAASRVAVEVAKLGDGFLSQKRHSLEAIVRYLLGEQTLDESLKWLKKHQDAPNYVVNQALSSSSEDEDEDDGLGEYIKPQDHGLESSDLNVAVNNAQYNVPLPKACGATWAENGRLVCFFAIKQEREISLLGQSLAGNSRPQKDIGGRLEEFGRLHNMTLPQKRATSTLGAITSGDSDDGEVDLSSSESSSSSDGLGIPSRHFITTMPWTGFTTGVQHDFALDGSLRSAGEIGQPSTAASKADMVVSIYDYSDLLPVKERLAREYVQYAGQDAASYNANVAKHHGFDDLADVWTFAGLVLQDKVPVEAVSNDDGAFFTIMRQTLSPLRDKDSAVDLSFDVREEQRQLRQSQPVGWAGHPFGQRWLIDSMFHHFELRADVQMLALLACVFAESPDLLSRRKDNRTLAYHDLNMHSVHYGNCSAQYYASKDVVVRLNNIIQPKLSKHTDSQTSSRGPYSATSSKDAGVSDPANSLSRSATPPFNRPVRNTFDEEHCHAISLSTAPEYYGQIHRTNSNLSALAASFPQSFRFTHSVASSPPNAHFQRLPNPNGTYLGPMQSNIAWAPSGWINRGTIIAEDAKPTFSVSISDTEDDMPAITQTAAVKRTLSYTLKNQDQFHEEGYAKIPLLDPGQTMKYRAWRCAYAQYLDIWDMPIAMAEILKQNYVASAPLDTPSLELHKSILVGSAANLSEAGSLEFRDHCTACSSSLPANEEATSNKCLICRGIQRPPLCIYCNTYILGLSSPCLGCGHIMHFSCRSEVASSGLFDECIAGCGCVCSEHPTVNMPLPIQAHQSRTRAMSMGGDVNPAIAAGGESPEVVRVNGQEQNRREDAAFLSLKRNLKGERRDSMRSLRAMGSQIWRGN